MKKTLKIMGVLLIMLLAINIVFAAEGTEEEPVWFKFLEIGGLVIGIIAASITFNNYFKMKGGVIGETFKYILIAISLIIVAIAINGLTEWFEIMNGFVAQLIYEIAIYTSLVLIAIASKKAMV